MIEPSPKRFKPVPLRIYGARSRRCLMCHKPFMSSWPGERVCPKCKSTQNWREGTTLRDEYE